MFEPVAVHIHDYKSVKNTFLDWQKTVVLTGRNATGKTNILEAIAFLLPHWSSGTSKDNYFEAFDKSVSCLFKGPSIIKGYSPPFEQSRLENYANIYVIHFLLGACNIHLDGESNRIAILARGTQGGILTRAERYFWNVPRDAFMEQAIDDLVGTTWHLAPKRYEHWRNFAAYVTPEKLAGIEQYQEIHFPEHIILKVDEVFQQILEAGVLLDYDDDGEVIIKENEPDDCLYLIDEDITHLIDSRGTAQNIINKYDKSLPGDSGSIWTEILGICFENVGVVSTRQQTLVDETPLSPDSEFNYCILPSAVSELKARGLLTESRLMQLEKHVPKEDTLSRNLLTGLIALDFDRNPYIVLETIPPEVPGEIDPMFRAHMVMDIAVIPRTILSQEIEHMVRDRCNTIRTCLLEYASLQDEDFIEQYVKRHEAVFAQAVGERVEDSNLPLIHVHPEQDVIESYYLDTLAISVNELLERFFGPGALAVKFDKESSVADIELYIQDFETEIFRHEGLASAVAQRWADDLTRVAINQFMGNTSLYEYEGAIGIFGSMGLNEEFDFSVYEKYAAGDLGGVEREIARAMSKTEKTNFEEILKPVLVVDEPEMHMHPGLQRRMAYSCESLTGWLKPILASHSIYFSDMNPETTDVVLVDKSREMTNIRYLDLYEQRDLTMLGDQLGCTKAEICNLVSLFLFVEGEHDSAFLENYYGQRLKRLHVKMIEIRGTKNLDVLEMVLKMQGHLLRQPKVLLVDNGKNGIAQRLDDESERKEIFRSYFSENGYRHLTHEEKDLIKMKKKYPELYTRALFQKDICMYVPASQLKPNPKYEAFPGWDRAAEEADAVLAEKRETDYEAKYNLKNHCADAYGIHINSSFIVTQASLMREAGVVAKDLEDFLRGLEELIDSELLRVR